MTQSIADGGTLELVAEDLLATHPWRAAAQDPQRVVFSRFAQERWLPITAADHLTAVTDVARGLIALGVEPGDRVALMANTRYEWLLIDQASWAAGAAAVPIYPSSAPPQVEWIVSDSGARVVVVETTAQAQAVAELGLGVRVLVLDPEDDSTDAVAELRALGADRTVAEVEARRDAVTFDSLASIIYTSGTTGRPKGVVVTHRHLAAEAKGLLTHPIGGAVRNRRVLMFLPMAHVLARAVTYTAVQGGSTVGFWGDFGTITDKLVSFRPHVVLGVPRVFEKVHAAVRTQATHRGPAIAEIFRRGEQVAVARSEARGGDGLGDSRRPTARERLERAVFERLLFRRVRGALGGECELAISGGGALNTRLAHFFRGIGVPVYEGYGMTETTAAITVNGPGCTRIGSVGPVVPGNRVRIGEGGEIEVQGMVVMDDYWQNPDATAKTFDDGWLRTGDLGTLDEDGYLTISGRAKEILVTAGGKNVAPGPLEDVIREHPLVANALVVGEGRPFVGALITLERPAVERWAQENGLGSVPIEELPKRKELRDEIQKAVDAANASVSKAESVRAFRLLADDFTEERSEMTAAMKLRRHVITKSRADAIEALYHR